MKEKQFVKSMINEAELYQNQGLLKESKEGYQKALQFIKSHQSFRRQSKLMDQIKNRIKLVEKSMTDLQDADQTPHLSQEVQDLIKDLFSFSKTKEAAKMEGAMALVKFGLYEQAIAEFQRLLTEGTMPLLGAKNILRCYISLSLPDKAIAQFKEWASCGQFGIGDLKYLKTFLENIVKKSGYAYEIPVFTEFPKGADGNEESRQIGLLDIISIKIPLNIGAEKISLKELEIAFQEGDVVSIMISAGADDLLEILEPGKNLPDIQFFSPIAVFRRSGIVSGRKEILYGPNRGDYMLDIRMDDEG
ncbi:hypothetical protein ACFL9T_11435 [Thermodesulfobacteriota bacterium]